MLGSAGYRVSREPVTNRSLPENSRLSAENCAKGQRQASLALLSGTRLPRDTPARLIQAGFPQCFAQHGPRHPLARLDRLRLGPSTNVAQHQQRLDADDEAQR